MKFELRNNRDFYAGVAFVLIGIVAAFMARGYSFGSSTQMGPGYFPTALAWILVLLGIVIAARGIRLNEKITVGWSPRAVIALTTSVLLFAILMPIIGLLSALAILIVGSATASSEFKWVEVIALMLLLIALISALDIFLLEMPFPLFGAY